MLLRYFLILCLLLFYTYSSAQEERRDIKYTLSLPNKDSLPDAKDYILNIIENHHQNKYTNQPVYNYEFYRKTSVDIVVHKDSVDSQIERIRNGNDLISKYLIRPFGFCFEHVKPNGDSEMKAATILLFEDHKSVFTNKLQSKNPSIIQTSTDNGIFQVLGHKNILSFLDEAFGDIDLFKYNSNVMLLSFKGPLNKENTEMYSYKLSGHKKLIGKDECIEIVFYSKDMQENAFSGYLYITSDDNPRLVEAEFMFNNPENINFLRKVAFRHKFSEKEAKIIPVEKENILQIGSDNKGTIVASRKDIYFNYSFKPLSAEQKTGRIQSKDNKKNDPVFWEQLRPIPLTASQMQLDTLKLAADRDKSFRRLESMIRLGLSGSLSIADGKADIGPLPHFVSYNDMEGLRVRVGGNTTINLSDRFQLGGYAAYGTKDQDLKYQANLAYSLLPKSKYLWEYPKKVIAFAYASDLNIPGQDVLLMNRDHFAQSFAHTPTDNMSHQQVALLSFESENSHNFTYKIAGKFTYDQPMGVVKYIQVRNNNDTTVINSITSSELQFSVRYAPGEKFFQRKERRTAIRRASIEFDFTHRIGIKRIFDSNHSYQVSNFNIFKRFSFDKNIGQIDTYLSGGKIWGQVSFPLLFIPEGNQSYVFSPTAYNCMNFYEFVTDRFISTSINTTLNWTPIRLFLENDKMKICLGAKMIYGPLSERNNPATHPELFMFNNGIRALGDVPYAEASIGIANIFKVLRIDYARRLTYTSGLDGEDITRGSILFSGSFSF
ncbi:hypothetical protein CLV62_14022 [Dysgonomonas alginatilytica]|uniref:Uncharacterized protein n=1 Tax=Dysgonomonas alginatilytica TaxID=1605892 RepID=A0A2V3PKA2_9BACT|nr:DUF5686 family protein [Dysgonomonas alginatilytica]PXV58946.1 hypothetical protein CLV62_14022 [Dysgonomonas alginatilytica]